MFSLCACHDFDESIALHGGNTCGKDEIEIIKRISSDYVIASKIKEGGGSPCIFRKYRDEQYENIAVLDDYIYGGGLIIENNCVYTIVLNTMKKYDLQSDEPYPLSPEVTHLFPDSSKLYVNYLIAYDETFLYVDAYRTEPNPENKYYKVSWDGSEYSEIAKEEIPAEGKI